MAESALRNRPDQTPARRRLVLGHPDLVAAGMNVDLAGQKLEMLLLAPAHPCDVLPGDVDLHVFRHVMDFGVQRVGRVAGVVELRAVAQQGTNFGEFVAGAHRPDVIGDEAVAKIEGREGQRTARVLLLCHAEQVRTVADLSLDLLLAIPEVVVGKDRHHDALDTA